MAVSTRVFHHVVAFEGGSHGPITFLVCSEGYGALIDLTVGAAAEVLRHVEQHRIALKHRLYTHGARCASVDAFADFTSSLGLLPGAPRDSGAHQALLDRVPLTVAPVAPWQAPGRTPRLLVRVGARHLELDPHGQTDTATYVVGQEQQPFALSTGRLLAPLTPRFAIEGLAGPAVTQRMAFRADEHLFTGAGPTTVGPRPEWIARVEKEAASRAKRSGVQASQPAAFAGAYRRSE